jgi:putative transposase
MVQQYRKKAGQRTGGIKLHNKHKLEIKDFEIKIGRGKLYRLMRTYNL